MVEEVADFVLSNIFTSCYFASIVVIEVALMNPTRQFPPKSRANGVRATLRYGNKPYWPMQWYMNEEVFSVKNQNYSPSMKIAEFHNFNSKGVNVGVVIIGNSPVNCEHSEITQRCFPNSSAYSYHAKKCIFFGCFKGKVCISNALPTAVAGIIGMTDQLQNGGVDIVIEPSTRGGSPEYGADKILSHSFDSGTYVFVHVWSLSSYEYQNRILHALDDIKMLNFNSKRQVLA
ncbi:unnamed protein product [Ilex paraguariensis]|uniref:Uncharacterized protein n=1 Tax=Ilex paraguariensis TaxID=185542 RepID=A0ABC8V0D0_9AQUA